MHSHMHKLLKVHCLRIDFDKWKDERNDDDETAVKPDDYNMPHMQKFDKWQR